MRTLAAALFLALFAGAPSHAVAQWGADPGLPGESSGDQSRMSWGGRLGFGSAQAGRATDEFGDPSLLFGTAYTGTALRFTGLGRYHLNDNLALRFELGFMRSATSGFADTDTYRRDLSFDLWTLDVPLAVDAGARVGPIGLRGIVGIGPRFGVSASAREERTAAVPPEPALEIRTGLAVPLHLGFEVTYHTNGNLSFPVEFRYMRNFGYPDKTEDRFDDYTDETDRGLYLVENDWHMVVQVGVDVRPGARAPRSTFVEPPPPPAPPPPPPQPDQDGDGIFDAIDACPLEPSQPGQPMPAPGCPASGGIVQLSCDRVYVSVPIEFESGLDTIKPESYPILYLLADTLQIAQNVTLLSIEGHTDDVGDPDENLWLSEWRAYSVLEFLIEAGISESRLQSYGYGEEYPLESNDTPEGRAANRRVEFHILENQTCDF